MGIFSDVEFKCLKLACPQSATPQNFVDEIHPRLSLKDGKIDNKKSEYWSHFKAKNRVFRVDSMKY
jgi:hypothetical protein